MSTKMKQKDLTPTEYELRREEIDRRYPKGRKGLGVSIKALRDQALAKLAHESGWTQMELAKIEGCSQTHIDCRLRFGRFLQFCITAGSGNLEKTANKDENQENMEHMWLHDITEYKFRGYWNLTEKKDERFRFRDVAAIIKDNTFVRTEMPKEFKWSVSDIAKNFNDGKWHTKEKIAKHFKVPIDEPDYRKWFLATMTKGKLQEAGGHRWERRNYKDTVQWRFIKKGGKPINPSILKTKIAPILKGLKIEGSKNMTTMSPSTVADLAHDLEQLINELSQ